MRRTEESNKIGVLWDDRFFFVIFYIYSVEVVGLLVIIIK